MNSSWICIVGILVLVACATPPAFNLPGDPGLPEEWGGYSSAYASGTDCPIVEGGYSSVPEIHTIDGKGSISEGDEYSLVTLFPIDLATKELVEPPAMSQNDPTFDVRQDGNSQIVLTHTWGTGQFVQASKFSSLEGDFTCVNGFIEFPINEHFGQIEGTTINGQVRRRMRKLEDGSLVVIRSFGPSRAWSGAGNIRVIHQYFRFRQEES